MANPQITVVNASLQVQGAAASDYSTLLIVDCNHLSLDRSAVYTGLDSYSNTVPSGSALRKALDSAFSALPKPPQVVAGRAKGKAVLAPTGVADGIDFDFTIEVEDGHSLAVSYTAGAAETAEDVATGLKADIDLDTDITDHVTATVVGTGADAVLELSLVASTDDFFLSAITDNLTVTGVASEAPADTLTAIREFNSQWTWIVSTDHTPSYQGTMAATATTLGKLYVTSTNLEEAYGVWDGVSTPDSNDIGALFAFNEYNYAHCMYHDQADSYPEAARITQFTHLKPGRSNFQYKSLSGFGVAQIADGTRALNDTELFNLSGKNISTILSYAGQSVVGGYKGTGNRMGSGTRMETMAVLVYFQQELKRKADSLLLRFPKLGMNENDFNKFRNSWQSFLDRNVSTASETAALDPYKPYTIEMPRPEDVSFEDRVDGILQDVKITCYLDASIDSAVINLVLTYRDPALEA